MRTPAWISYRKANFLKNLVPWMADPKLPAEARDRWVEIWTRADSTLGTEVRFVFVHFAAWVSLEVCSQPGSDKMLLSLQVKVGMEALKVLHNLDCGMLWLNALRL